MDVTIRDATEADRGDYLRLFTELGVDDPQPSQETWSQRLMPATQIAEHDGRVIGFVFCQALDALGFVRQIVVDPAHRRSSLGRRLMHAAAARLRAAGLQRWQLNVKPDNVAAIGLYSSLGMRKDHDSVVLRLPWEKVASVPDAGGVAALAPERDEEVERALAQPTGMLASCRTRSDLATILFVESGAGVQGLAAFDAHFGGAYPFVARDAEVAAGLLRSMLARRIDNGRDFVQLVVESDPTLVAQLERWGAGVMMRISLYSGPLPAEPSLEVERPPR